MTILEMHIEIDLGVQKLDSSAYRDIGHEEKDRILNKMQQFLVDGLIDPSADLKQLGFQANTRRLTDIKELIVRNKELGVFIEGSEPNCEYAILPTDFLYAIPGGQRAFTKLPCSSEAIPEIKEMVVHSFVLDIPKSDSYADLTIHHLKATTEGMEKVELFKAADYYPDGLEDVDLLYELQRFLVDSVNRKFDGSLTAKWTTENNQDRVTFISGNYEEGEKILLTLDGKEVEVTSKSSTVRKYDFSKGKYKQDYYKTRLVGQDDLYDLAQNSLSKSKYTSPLSVLANEKLYIYNDGKFHVEKLLMDYVRKPRLMNYAQGHSCEIESESVQYRIVDMTIKHIIRAIESGSYQPVAVENQLSQ